MDKQQELTEDKIKFFHQKRMLRIKIIADISPPLGTTPARFLHQDIEKYGDSHYRMGVAVGAQEQRMSKDKDQSYKHRAVHAIIGLLVTGVLLYFLFWLGEREYSNRPVQVATGILLMVSSIYTFIAAASHMDLGSGKADVAAKKGAAPTGLTLEKAEAINAKRKSSPKDN